VIGSSVTTCDGQLLALCLLAGLDWLGQRRDAVNAMNVFPVPDGDTGTNMWHTLESACAAMRAVEERHLGRMCETMARGALRGARGNSGTILSMLLRGFAGAVAHAETMDGRLFAAACNAAVAYAYNTVRAVMPPVEGTILTVARVAAEELGASQPDDLLGALKHLTEAAREALAQTPRQLPVLAEAGVVDSGGYGLLTILEGVLRFAQGEPLGDAVAYSWAPGFAAVPRTWQEALKPPDDEGYGYDVQFLMVGQSLNLAQIREDISGMGWSPLVDGDERMVKVHIHVYNPGQPLAYAVQQGAQLLDIVVENMQAQYLDYVAARSGQTPPPAPADDLKVIAVAAGEGLRQVFLSAGASGVIAGGQTMNPSVEDFIQAIHEARARRVILLPNNGNLILSATQAAAAFTDREVLVIPTRTIPQGIAALLAYWDRDEKDLMAVEQVMRGASAGVTTVELTTAVRDVPAQSIVKGAWLGLVDDRLVTSGADAAAVLLDALASAGAGDAELITLYYGADVPARAAKALQHQVEQRFADAAVEVVHGGQPLYAYIVSVE
jgi:hypothetical protein